MIRRKRVMAPVAALGMLVASWRGASAIAADKLVGSYAFQTAGTASILPANSGQCASKDTVPAGLIDGFIRFDGGGNITGANVGISIGSTTCTSPNYRLSGRYTIEKNGDKTIEASGTLTMTFQGRPAACSGTALVEQPFTLIANLDGTQTTFTIETYDAGAGSTYAEGPPPGPLTCTAPIGNFLTSGTGKREGL
jgi:hypothetical protein